MKKAIETVRLSINLELDIKKEFLSICKGKETDANKVIRTYIKRYILKNRKELEK